VALCRPKDCYHAVMSFHWARVLLHTMPRKRYGIADGGQLGYGVRTVRRVSDESAPTIAGDGHGIAGGQRRDERDVAEKEGQ